MLRILLLIVMLYPAFSWSADAESETTKGSDYALYTERLVARQLLSEMLGEAGKKSVRGVTAVWVDVVVQKRADTSAFKALEEDLRMTALEGQLRTAGFRLLKDGKKSIAPGPKPTVTVMVLHALARAVGDNAKPFYVVITCAKQDTARMGREASTLVTWAHVSEPIPSDDDDLKDADAIRAAAKVGVQAFIQAAKDGE